LTVGTARFGPFCGDPVGLDLHHAFSLGLGTGSTSACFTRFGFTRQSIGPGTLLATRAAASACASAAASACFTRSASRAKASVLARSASAARAAASAC
jgi:hypothetical protein